MTVNSGISNGPQSVPGAMIMNDDVEFLFTPGSVITCQTCLGKQLEGEVIAFDYEKRVLLIKTPASGQHPTLNDVRVINLSYVSDLKVKKEMKRESSNALPELNIPKIQEKTRRNVAERKDLYQAFKAGVTAEGVEVFMILSKTVGNVTWDGRNIVVSNDVTICPPYKSDTCTVLPRAKNPGALSYVQTLVKKHWDQKPAVLPEGQQSPPTAPEAAASTTTTTSKPTTAPAPRPAGNQPPKPAPVAPGNAPKGQQKKQQTSRNGANDK